MTPQSAQAKVLELLSEISRPGIDKVIEFLHASNYFTSARCYKHHRCMNGLLMHSLEVLDAMLKNNIFSLSRESIIIVALFHDLGKATLNRRMIGSGDHCSRSVDILEQCGFELTEQESSAIYNHHPGKHLGKLARAASNPLQLLLHAGDCISTGVNKRGSEYKFSCLRPGHN